MHACTQQRWVASLCERARPLRLRLQIHHPIDYAKVVQRVRNEMDLTLVALEDIMPAATIMVLTVTATTTSGKELSQVRPCAHAHAHGHYYMQMPPAMRTCAW